MHLTWSARRQLLYYGVAFIVVAVLFYFGYQSFFTTAPTCFDGAQNGDETGVDCGGSCSLVCAADAHAPIVLWARAFEVSPGDYAAAAYIKNPNVGAGAKNVAYSFQLFDSQNSLVVERDGVIDLPPTQTVPVIETNINTGTRSVAHTLFAFGSSPVWNKVSTPALHVSNQSLSQDGTHLSATLVNDTSQNIAQVVVDAVLFDASSTAVAASKSVVSVDAHGSTPLIFTWPAAAPGVVRAEITVLPPF